jgi:hypothetical protein
MWLAACLLCGANGLRAQVNVTTYHNDNARSGTNSQETVLTPANVNSTQFGKLFSVAVDGYVYAQPLYLSAVSIGGGTHNVVYVATEHDSVYAIDADNGMVYWQTSLIAPGGRTFNTQKDITEGCTDLVPEIGITGTPVIDTTTGTLYVVAKSTVNGTGVQYLHALDVASAAEKFGGPVSITGSVAGSGYDANNKVVRFNPVYEGQRAALLLENGHVLIAWASHCDTDPWHGWVMSYSAATLAQEGVFNASANGERSGIWMSGGGLAADSSGAIYFATGNGTWNGTSDYGDSIVKLGAPAGGSFPVLDYFTPYDQNYLDDDDVDLASGGLTLLPTQSSGRQLLAQQGKQGTIYLLDRNNLGKYCVKQSPPCNGNDPQIVQEIFDASGGVWGSPAYWNDTLYWTAANEPIRAYSFNANNSGLLSTKPTSETRQVFPFSAPTPSISSNGNTNAIVWALDGSDDNSTCVAGEYCLGLFAYDATDLATLLYSSAQAANNRDAPGNALKFETPIIANGKVYVGTQYAVSAYGELGTTLPPVLTPAPGAYLAGQQVALSDANSSAVIYYTTNGTMPTSASTRYSGPLQLTATTTIEAIAVSGAGTSTVAGGVYTVTAQGNAPVSVNLAPVDNVTALVNSGSPVPNTGLDGNGDAYSANLTGTSVTWAGSVFTLGAAGSSDAASSTTISLPPDSVTTLNLLATGVNGNQANQTFVVTYTDGTTTRITQSLSDWHTPQNYAGESLVLTMGYRVTASGAADNRTFYLYGYSFALNSSKTVRSLTLPNNRDVVVLAVDLSSATASNPPAATPTLSPPPGAYSSAQTITLADSSPGSTIYYTTDGSTPTVNSTAYRAPFQIGTTTTVEAIATASGYGTSAVAAGTYTISAQGNAPVSVNLAPIGNVIAIANNGSAVPDRGLDGGGDAFSSSLIGTSINWGGATYTLGGAGTIDAASGITIALPSGNATTVSLLATGANGSQSNQTFIVTYTDGTTTRIVQSVSDWHTPQSYAGESQVLAMPYRLTSSGAADDRTFYLYGYSFAVNGAKTIQSITLPHNRNVVVLAIDVSETPAQPPISVNLAPAANVVAIASDGAPVPDGGLDGEGDAYSATLTNTSLNWAGAPFTLGSPGIVDAVSGTTIALPAGNDASLNLLASGVRGNQPNQTFVVTYTDGTTTRITQSLSDWHTPQNYAGESTALTMAYRLTPNGAADNRTFYLYGYSFALNSGKTLQSITLPTNRDVVVLSIDLTP